MRVFTLSSGKAVAVERTLDMDAATSTRYRLTRRCGGGFSFCGPDGESLFLLSLLPCEGMIESGRRLGPFCTVVGESTGISPGNLAPRSSRL